jgi:GntR family transcriptional regulator
MTAALSTTPLLGQSRYGTLATALRQRVLDGEWKPGQMLPSEAALASGYGVALGTMRQALALLVEDGIVRRQHGKGTFVSTGLDSASMMRFFRFQADSTPTTAPASHILQRRFRRPSAAEAQSFGIEPTGQVMQLERLRSIEGRPCLLEDIVLPLPLFGALADSNTSDWDDLLYPMYQQRCGLVVQHAQDALSFSHLNARQAGRLKLASGHPCVVVDRLAFGISGRCVERRSTRGDAYSFTYTAHVK